MTRLLVPVHVAALVERVAGETYADTALRPADLSVTKPTRQRLHPEPFSNGAARPLGVHLHWALPDALARYDNEHKRFPRLPCRWVIVRSSGPTSSQRRAVHAWVLADIHQASPLVVSLPGTVPATSGAADLDVSGPQKTDPAWFAYYDNTLNRLAFYDPLTDTPTGPLSYLVCGWYVRTRFDPLNTDSRPLSEADLRGRLATLGWEVRGPLGELPTASLFHGAAVAIGWPAAGWPGDGGALLAETDARPDAATLDIGLGDRTSSVLADLLTDGNAAAAQLIEMLVGGEIQDLAHVDGTATAAANAHRDRFVTSQAASTTSELVYVPTAVTPPPPTVWASSVGDRDAAHPWRGGLLAADAAARAGAPTPPPPPDPFDRSTTRLKTRTDPANAITADAAVDPGELERVRRPVPRQYLPLDPQLVVERAGRSYRHGEDGRFGPLGRLPCRVSGETVTVLGRPNETDGVGRDALPVRADGRVDLPTSGLSDVAGDIEALVVEVNALDPAVNPTPPGTPEIDPLAQLRADWLAAAARRSTPGAGPGDEPPDARTDGSPPAPIAITLPERPWNPLHVDWSLDWRPSPRGTHDWVLDDLDFEPSPSTPADGPVAQTVTGRALLSATPARLLASSIIATLTHLAQQPDGSEVIEGILAAFGASDTRDLVHRFTHADLIGAHLDGYVDRLRGKPPGQWIASSGVVGSPIVIRRMEASEVYEATPLVAGTFVPGVMRLVDTFGRFLTIEPASGPPVRIGRTLQHPDDPTVALQRPRFTAPATIEFRYISPYAAGDLGRTDVDPGQSPLTGFLTPNPFDGSIEIHTADALSVGRLQLDRHSRAVWQESPGTVATYGAPPNVAIGDRNPAERNLAGIAAGVLDHDRALTSTDPYASALVTLLRAIDITRYTVDPTAKAGDQHLQALLGNPVAILRARLRLTVDDPQADQAAPVSIPVRLGSIARINDGLLGFYLTDELGRLRLVHPALADAAPLPALTHRAAEWGAAAITEDQADTSGVVWLTVGQDLDVLLLVSPGADVNAATGLLPNKVLEMQREWVDRPMAQLTPTLRFETVVRDPRSVRVPVATDIHGTWHWHHRPSSVEWATEPVQVSLDGQLDEDHPAVVHDGYLRVDLVPDPPYLGVPFKITNIKRIGPANTIQRLRVVSPTAKVVDLTIDEGIEMVESGRFNFFTEVQGFPRVDVIVDVTPAGRKYLRTNADQTTGNNLGSLPPF